MDRPPEESEEIAAYESIYEGTLNFISRRGGQHLNQPIDRHYAGPRRGGDAPEEGGRGTPRERDRWGGWRSTGEPFLRNRRRSICLLGMRAEIAEFHHEGTAADSFKAALSRFGRFDSRRSPASRCWRIPRNVSCLISRAWGRGGAARVRSECAVRVGTHVDTVADERLRNATRRSSNRRDSVKSTIRECACALCRYPRCRRCDYVTPSEGGGWEGEAGAPPASLYAP